MSFDHLSLFLLFIGLPTSSDVLTNWVDVLSQDLESDDHLWCFRSADLRLCWSFAFFFWWERTVAADDLEGLNRTNEQLIYKINIVFWDQIFDILWDFAFIQSPNLIDSIVPWNRVASSAFAQTHWTRMVRCWCNSDSSAESSRSCADSYQFGIRKRTHHPPNSAAFSGVPSSKFGAPKSDSAQPQNPAEGYRTKASKTVHFDKTFAMGRKNWKITVKIHGIYCRDHLWYIRHNNLKWIVIN